MLFSSLPNFLSGVSLFFYFEIYNYSQWKKTWIIQQQIVVPFFDLAKQRPGLKICHIPAKENLWV